MVTDTVGEIRRDTLLWYRLACSLPATLPERAWPGSSRPMPISRAQDYRFVLEQLGPCATGV